jgi:23S rRNA (uridine2552-2'-O)-methyltransferase
MSGKDDYYNRAKQEGYRARSAYKLKQLDETADLLGQQRTVVDLGAAPGGWLQVAAEAVGDGGVVVGVDRQRIDELDEDHGASLEYVRGDMTDSDTVAEVVDIVGEADVVISDMAPDMTGDYDLDHARSVHLASQAFDVAQHVLGAGGDFAAKVFDGRDLDDLKERVGVDFEYVREVRPEASRDSSSELYLVGKGFLTAPVREGDTLEVTIEGIGDEGDGVAKVEDFTLFVSGAGEGETLTVRVDDVKPNFGFAQPLTE